MGTDHGILCSWRTPDLIYRDQKLRARTAVCGMSRNAMIIHIVALVVTSGTSLPINLLFGIRHAATYNKVKHERHSIRQILGTRNVTYTGRGQWMVPQVTHPGPGPGPWMDPNVGQRVHPNGMHYHGGGQHWADPNVIDSHGTGQWADPDGGNNNNYGSDLQDQFAQAAAQSTFDAASQYFNTN